MLNCMPWFKDGSHERIYNAMLNGAICVTDESKYLKEQFIHGQNIVFYELNDIPSLVENIKYLLSHSEVAEKIALKGYCIAHERDTWERRLDTLLNFMKEDVI